MNRQNSDSREEPFDIKKLNLNSTMLVDTSLMSSSSLALVNAKSKAMKRIDTMFQDGVVEVDLEPNEHLFKSTLTDSNPPSSSNSRSDASQKGVPLTAENPMDDFDNHMENLEEIIKPTDNTVNRIDATHLIDDQKTREPIMSYTASYKIAINSPIRRSDTEVLNLSDEEMTSKKVNLNTQTKKQRKGFALFGRKKYSASGQLYYGNQLHRNSIKSKATPKKINNKIDWSENSRLGMHVWSDHSNPANDSCYVSELDALKFHNINSQGKCLYTSKNVPKKKCDVCKIVVHEACVESLQVIEY